VLLATRIVGVPLIAGCPSSSSSSPAAPLARWVQLIIWPGMQLQKLTTREPDHEQLAVAIAALEAVLGVEDPAAPRTCWGSKSSPRLGPRDRALVEQIEGALPGGAGADGGPRGDRGPAALRDAGRLFNQLAPAARLAEEWRRAVSDAEGAEELLAEGEDPELRGVLIDARERIAELEEEIRLAMVERDPNDDKDVIVEIAAGAGGDEAGPVGRGPLPHAHQARRAPRLQDRDDVGRRRLLHVRDQGRRRVLRVQVRGRHAPRAARPETESQGRIHTSTATVAVLPEAEDVEVEIDQNDLQIDVYRSSGPAASRSTRPTPPCGSRTSRPASSSRCRTRSPSCRTASAR
jgi:hypothetical protein